MEVAKGATPRGLAEGEARRSQAQQREAGGQRAPLQNTRLVVSSGKEWRRLKRMVVPNLE